MAQKKDISALLKEWPYQPGQVNARLILGADNLERVQVRLDLGVLQMFAEGRPDGEQPFGFPSLLEYHEARVDGEVEQEEVIEGESKTPKEPESPKEEEGGAMAEGPAEPTPGEKPEVRLTPDECRALREEAAQFYQRYVACLALDEFERVIRDTTRNLRVLDLCHKYAETESDRSVMEQFRAYITMMRSRALASQSLKDNQPKLALIAIDDGLNSLQRFFAETDQAESFEDSSEVQILRGMREALTPKLPLSQSAELRTRLEDALRKENYELAAILRDELKAMEKKPPEN